MLFDPATVFVNDGVLSNQRLQGFSFAQTGSTIVQIFLEQIDSYTGTQALLDASASSGITATDDDATWAGVTDFVLTIV